MLKIVILQDQQSGQTKQGSQSLCFRLSTLTTATSTSALTWQSETTVNPDASKGRISHSCSSVLTKAKSEEKKNQHVFHNTCFYKSQRVGGGAAGLFSYFVRFLWQNLVIISNFMGEMGK